MSTDSTVTYDTPNDPEPSNDDKNIATITHLSGMLFAFIPSLVVWLLKKDDNAYIAAQAKEALNFQVTIVIAQLVAAVLIWVLIGFLLMPLIWLANIVLCIIAAINTSKGETYRYPFSLRLIN
jgi:uncharacterized Tic20 family protein